MSPKGDRSKDRGARSDERDADRSRSRSRSRSRDRDDAKGGKSSFEFEAGTVHAVHTMVEWKAAIAFNKKDNTPLVVDFTAIWCGPCQRIAPFFRELAKNNKKVCFIKVDVDELEELTEKVGVQAMPTFQLYKKGEEVTSVQGASEDKLSAMVSKA
jgi:thioredoxin 1